MRKDIAPGIFTIADVLTAEECRELVAWSESLGYEAAPVTLASGFVQRPDIRNNTRAMVDAPKRAQQIWSRIAADVSSIFQDRRVVGLNERLRFYRYDPGQKFAPHTDGCFRRENGEESLLTLMIYLSGGARGGETRFEDASITPEAGLALLFDHYLLHEGAPVIEGRKYVLRSDVMYAPA
jgi:predicted 2-oxoglutarate/Fe(II)-dependent dioxygenase YbiX